MIAWGVVAALPVSVVVTAFAVPHEPIHLTTKAVVGLPVLAPVAAVVVLACIAVTQRTRT